MCEFISNNKHKAKCQALLSVSSIKLVLPQKLQLQTRVLCWFMGIIARVTLKKMCSK